MDIPSEVIERAIREIDLLLRSLKRGQSHQVRSQEERELIRANVSAWFKTHRQQLAQFDGNPLLRIVDTGYTSLLKATDKGTTREQYYKVLGDLRSGLSELRSAALLQMSAGAASRSQEKKPDFAKLVSDQQMIAILERRWDETVICLRGGAYLAATVMMGALLEALLLARVNKLVNKTPIFKLKSTPKDGKGKPRPLSEWGLNDFIEVASEMRWIGESAKKIGGVLRDYRNFIHPVKQLSSGIHIEGPDAKMFWAVFVQITEQIIEGK